MRRIKNSFEINVRKLFPRFNLSSVNMYYFSRRLPNQKDFYRPSKINELEINQKITLGINLIQNKNFEKAKEIFLSISNTLSSPKSSKEFITLGNIYNTLSKIYVHEGDLDNTLDYTDKAISIFKTHLDESPSNQILISNLYHNKGKLKMEFNMKNPTYDFAFSGKPMTEKVSDYFESKKNSKDFTPIFNFKIEEILEEFNQAKDILTFLEKNNPKNEKILESLHEIQNDLSSLYLYENNPFKSISMLIEGLEYLVKLRGENNHEVVAFAIFIANKLVEIGKFNEAKEMTKKALYYKRLLCEDEDDEQTYEIFNLIYRCAQGLHYDDNAKTALVECLRIKKFLLKKFEKEMSEKKNTIEVSNTNELLHEKDMKSKLVGNYKEPEINMELLQLENILKEKVSGSNSPNHGLFQEILEKIEILKSIKEKKEKSKEALAATMEINQDIQFDDELKFNPIQSDHFEFERKLNPLDQKKYQIAFIQEKLSELNIKLNNMDDAYISSLESESIYYSLSSPRIHRAYSNLAVVYFMKENWVKCIEYAKKALVLKNQTEELCINNGYLCQLIAKSYFERNLIDKAIKYQLKSVVFCDKYEGPETPNYILNQETLGNYYLWNKNFEKALYHLKIAHDLMMNNSESQEDIRSYCLLGYKIGSLYYEKNDYESAITYFDKIVGINVNFPLNMGDELEDIIKKSEVCYNELAKKPGTLTKLFGKDMSEFNWDTKQLNEKTFEEDDEHYEFVDATEPDSESDVEVDKK